MEAEVSPAEAVEVLEEVVAGASGTVGRFRGVGDFPDARRPRLKHGEMSSTSLTLGDAAPRYEFWFAIERVKK